MVLWKVVRKRENVKVNEIVCWNSNEIVHELVRAVAGVSDASVQ